MTFPEDPIERFPMGQRVRMFVDFTNAAGAPDDPDVVLLSYLEGDSDNLVAVLQAALTNPTIGRWHFELNLPLDGNKTGAWSYRFEGTSASAASVNAVDEKRFEVSPSPFYPPS
jgi:hypothetical protein